MSKKRKEIIEADWVVMRLLVHILRTGHGGWDYQRQQLDAIHTFNYLTSKYTKKTARSAVDRMLLEYPHYPQGANK